MTTFLKKGMYKFFRSEGSARQVNIAIPNNPKIICKINFNFDDKPCELLLLIFFKSSNAPNTPKENTINIKNQLKGFDKSHHNNIQENNTRKINSPHIVGVPIFFII